MAETACRRALRVAGVPKEVVAWVDHDRHANLLFLNAECFTTQEENAITEALAQPQGTIPELLHALVSTKGEGFWPTPRSA